jgi:Na+/H+ antiporter NhaC
MLACGQHQSNAFPHTRQQDRRMHILTTVSDVSPGISVNNCIDVLGATVVHLGKLVRCSVFGAACFDGCVPVASDFLYLRLV